MLSFNIYNYLMKQMSGVFLFNEKNFINEICSKRYILQSYVRIRQIIIYCQRESVPIRLDPFRITESEWRVKSSAFYENLFESYRNIPHSMKSFIIKRNLFDFRWNRWSWNQIPPTVESFATLENPFKSFL